MKIAQQLLEAVLQFMNASAMTQVLTLIFPGSDNTGTENINYGVDSKKTIFRRDGFRPET